MRNVPLILWPAVFKTAWQKVLHDDWRQLGWIQRCRKFFPNEAEGLTGWFRKPRFVQLFCLFLLPLSPLHHLCHLDHHSCGTGMLNTCAKTSVWANPVHTWPKLLRGRYAEEWHRAAGPGSKSGINCPASAQRLCHFQTHLSQPDTVLSGKLSWVPNGIHHLLSLLPISYPWIEGEHYWEKIHGLLGICEEE